MVQRRTAACLLVVMLILLASVGAGGTQAEEAKQLRIVKQPGLGYLQLIVMREKKLIEKRAPGVAVEWHQLTSGPVIRDAMVAGQLDIGSGAFGPFAQAIDKGIDWKTVGALTEMPVFLTCARPDIKSLRDLKASDRIAMPAIGSFQHVILQMEAEKELGDPKKLNAQIVAMGHPDGMAAILSKREITCHLSSPPFQYEELRDPGIHKLFDSYQVLGGPHTFTLVWASAAWAKANPELVKAFVAALREATDFISAKPEEAARLYATTEKSKLSPEDTLALMRQPGIRYTMTPSGFMKIATFMKKIGMIRAVPASWQGYAFDDIAGLPGS